MTTKRTRSVVVPGMATEPAAVESDGQGAVEAPAPAAAAQHLNNIAGSNPNSEAAQHEAVTAARIAAARAEELAQKGITETGAPIARSASVAPGTVVVPAPSKVRQTKEEAKYGREYPFPPGTHLNKEMKQCEGAEEAAFIVGRVSTEQGWLVGRAIPIAEVQGL